MDERMRIKEAFDSVHAEKRLKEHTRDYLHRRFYKETKRRVCYAGYAAACSLFLLLGIGGYAFYFTPVTYISIDINPSIELELNRLDRIIAIIPYNEDGAAAVENLSLKNQKYDDGILALLESGELSPYLSGDARITISVASNYDDKNAKITERVMESTREQYNNVSCHSGSGEEMQRAHHAGLSFGKYRAYLELQSLNPEVTIEEIKEMSMREIQDILDERQNEAAGDRDGERHKAGCSSENRQSRKHRRGACE